MGFKKLAMALGNGGKSFMKMCSRFHTMTAHTHTLRFNGHFPGEPGLAGCLLKQKMMEVVVTTGAMSRAKLQSNPHHQRTDNQLFTGRMPFLSPNQQCQSTEGKNKRHRLSSRKDHTEVSEELHSLPFNIRAFAFSAGLDNICQVTGRTSNPSSL